MRIALRIIASLATILSLSAGGLASFQQGVASHPHIPAVLLDYQGRPVHTWVAGHPVNAQGFVMDGSPQLSDAKCVGDQLQRSECFLARRPACQEHGRKSWDEVVSCYAPLVDLYPWPATWALNVIECESGGDEWEVNPNGLYDGLMQEGGGPLDGAQNIYNGYWDYWRTRGGGPWTTSGEVCH